VSLGPLSIVRRCGAILCASWLLAARVGAVACPDGGVAVTVCVKNPTTTPKTATISGDAITNQCTCTGGGAAASYSIAITLAAGGPGSACQPFTTPKLMTGMWLHRIRFAASPGGRGQDRKGVVLAASPGMQQTTVNWTYAPQVLFVNKTVTTAPDDTTSNVSTSCPVNALSSPAACTLRKAILRANQISSANSPVLIRFIVSPGKMFLSDQLTIGGSGYVTIDRVEATGKPWIVGDANAKAAGNQDSFACVVDLNNSTAFTFASSNNTIQGLRITNTLPSGAQQTKDLITFAAGTTGNVVKAVKIEGGNTLSCPIEGCAGSHDLFSALSSDANGGKIVNVEGHSALDKGVKANAGRVAVFDSWFHHNYRGGLQATFGGFVDITANLIEKSGRRITDDLQVDAGANGVAANESGSQVTGGGLNLSRLNTNNGFALNAPATINFLCDSACGNRFSGAGAKNNSPFTLWSRGSGFYYNGGKGVAVTSTSGGGSVDFGCSQPGVACPGSAEDDPGDNAFARNDSSASPCDFENQLPPPHLVRAVYNQWGTNPPALCGGQPVNTGVIQDAIAEQIVLTPTIPTRPSNVILQGQTFHVIGVGFNAIDGNPAITGTECAKGDNPTQSCCLTKPQAANVCGEGTHDPIVGKGNCVELQTASGTWVPVPVTNVTPGDITAYVPDAVFGCTGDSSLVHVSKRGPNGEPIRDFQPHCTNQNPKVD
jgi:hypothetical protein